MNLPNINFATANPDEIELEVVSTVEQLLGRKLERADPIRLFLRGVELLIIQQRMLIDATAKQNLLAYATGDNLDHLGALVGCERLQATAAKTTVTLTLSAEREVATTIAKGTRLTADNDIYFALDEDVIILAGETLAAAKATCTSTGTAGNGYAAGELTRIVDPQPFLLSMVNTTTSEGGADIETDDHYRERTREEVESFSCAGSAGAYVARTKEVSALIIDVAVTSPTPGVVNIYPLMEGGTLPETEMLNAIAEHLNEKTIRPLTDCVQVLPPEVVTFNVDVKYWISRSDAVLAASIMEAANSAVDEYIDWQRSALGKDINPSKLIGKLMGAGVKRVEVTSPTFAEVASAQLAQIGTKVVTFAGLEDD